MSETNPEVDSSAQWRPAAVGRALADMILSGELGPEYHGQVVVYDRSGITNIVPRAEYVANVQTWVDEGTMYGSFTFQHPDVVS